MGYFCSSISGLYCEISAQNGQQLDSRRCSGSLLLLSLNSSSGLGSNLRPPAAPSMGLTAALLLKWPLQGIGIACLCVGWKHELGEIMDSENDVSFASGGPEANPGKAVERSPLTPEQICKMVEPRSLS